MIDLAWSCSKHLSARAFVKPWNYALPCINTQGIKNAQLGRVWCRWKEIYLKVMVHSCRGFGVWPWQIVVVELVIVHTQKEKKVTAHGQGCVHKHLHGCVGAAHPNTSTRVNWVLNMYTNWTYKQSQLGCPALQWSAPLFLNGHHQHRGGEQ